MDSILFLIPIGAALGELFVAWLVQKSFKVFGYISATAVVWFVIELVIFIPVFIYASSNSVGWDGLVVWIAFIMGSIIFTISCFVGLIIWTFIRMYQNKKNGVNNSRAYITLVILLALCVAGLALFVNIFG